MKVPEVFGVEVQGDWVDLTGSNVSRPSRLSPIARASTISACSLAASACCTKNLVLHEFKLRLHFRHGV